VVLFTFLVEHEQFKVIAGVEDVKVVYETFFICFFEISFCYPEKWFRDNMVAG